MERDNDETMALDQIGRGELKQLARSVVKPMGPIGRRSFKGQMNVRQSFIRTSHVLNSPRRQTTLMDGHNLRSKASYAQPTINNHFEQEPEPYYSEDE